MATVTFANQKQEKIICCDGKQKTSESVRTTMTDGKTEARSANTKLFNLLTNEISFQQELVLVEIRKNENIEVQKTTGTYVTLSNSNSKKIAIQKIESIDSYQIEGVKRL
ncbi:MAG: hypothetical protein WA160_08935 [Pseudobdellovibrio sp.]